MKQWIKLEFALLKDARIERLIDELGIKGLGAYTIVRLLVECRNDGELSMSELLQAGSEHTSRRIIRQVVNNYDLFCVNENGFVCVCVRASARASARAGVRASARTSARASEPIISKENKNKDIEGEGERETALASSTTSYSSPQRVIDQVRQWLMNDSNLIWREPMMMHSGYGLLLKLHWSEAVEFFIQHMLSQDKLGAMYNEHEARQYFTNFSKVSVGSGKALMSHLSQLNDKANHTTALPLANDGRPPKPSPTAQWSYATEEWVEIH